MQRRTSAPCGCRAAVASAPAKSSRQSRNQSFDGQTLYRHEWKAAHGNRGKCAAGEVFGCIPHGARAYRESDSFAMWAVHHGVTVSMTTVSISSDPFIPPQSIPKEARN